VIEMADAEGPHPGPGAEKRKRKESCRCRDDKGKLRLKSWPVRNPSQIRDQEVDSVKWSNCTGLVGSCWRTGETSGGRVVWWSDPRWDFKRTAEATLTGALKRFYRVATRMGLPGYAQPAPGPLAKHGRAIFEPDYEFQESEIAKAYESSDRRSFGNYCSPLCSP